MAMTKRAVVLAALIVAVSCGDGDSPPVARTDGPSGPPALKSYEERVLYCTPPGQQIVGGCQEAGGECCCGSECCSGMCANGTCARGCSGAGQACGYAGKSLECCSGECGGNRRCNCISMDTPEIPCQEDGDCCTGFCNPDTSRCENYWEDEAKYAAAPTCSNRARRTDYSVGWSNGGAQASMDDFPAGYGGQAGSSSCSVDECHHPTECCSGICNPATNRCVSCAGAGAPCGTDRQGPAKFQEDLWTDECCSKGCSYNGVCLPSSSSSVSSLTPETGLCGADVDCDSNFCWMEEGRCLPWHCDLRLSPYDVRIDSTCDNLPMH